jgi:thermitase
VQPVQPVHLLDSVDPNGPNDDPSYSNQWSLATQPGANFSPAWANNFAGAGIRIAIVDTGVRLTHQNFGGQVVAGPDLVTNPDPNSGVVVTGDPHGHGTHTAGIAGAKDNDTGTLGGAPNATIIAVRVLNSCGSGSSTDVANGITWAADPARGNAKVISLSLGGSASIDMQKAVEYAYTKGVVVVAAAGNDGSGSCNPNAVEYPGGYSTDTQAAVIAAAATDNTGKVASYSNCGSFVSIAAPGSSIYSTWAASDTSYTTLSGTSMATPLVAAAAALMEEKCPAIAAGGAQEDAGRVRSDLQTNSAAPPPGQTFRSLDAGAATTAAC